MDWERKKREKIAKERGGGNLPLNIQLPEMFIVNLIKCLQQVTQKHYLSSKILLLSERRPKQTKLVSEGESGEGSVFGAFKSLLNVEFNLG